MSIKAVYLILLTGLVVNAFSLTEAEEFELYKEFKMQKATESSLQKEASPVNDAPQAATPTPVIIHNNNQPQFVAPSVAENSWSQREFIRGASLYEANKKTPFVASIWGIIIPTAGHLYAGSWGRSIPFLVGMVGGTVLVVGSMETVCRPTYVYRDKDTDNEYLSCEVKIVNESQYSVGAAIVALSYIWSIFDAYDSANDYNQTLRKGFGLTMAVPGYRGVTAGVAYRF
jgi:hypothetical protein